MKLPDKQTTQLVRQLEAQGFRVSWTASGHIRVQRDGQLVILAGTPSGSRSRQNGLALLKRAGYIAPGARGKTTITRETV